MDSEYSTKQPSEIGRAYERQCQLFTANIVLIPLGIIFILIAIGCYATDFDLDDFNGFYEQYSRRLYSTSLVFATLTFADFLGFLVIVIVKMAYSKTRITLNESITPERRITLKKLDKANIALVCIQLIFAMVGIGYFGYNVDNTTYYQETEKGFYYNVYGKQICNFTISICVLLLLTGVVELIVSIKVYIKIQKMLL